MRGSKRRGIATVEVALILPVLITLTFALMEYGWFFINAQRTTNAARQGARLAAMPDTTVAEVASFVDALMSEVGGGYTVEIQPGSIEDIPPGDPVTVTITVPYQDNLELFGFLPVPANISAAVTMAKEGP
ncbi:MAG: pilus assembly protein [Planctomycetes bacterium]|nr:pilus assembly protein [Planctomycetota bacterium]